jgi:hypothetical protein
MKRKHIDQIFVEKGVSVNEVPLNVEVSSFSDSFCQSDT